MIFRIAAASFLIGFGLTAVAVTGDLLGRRQARAVVAAEGFVLVALDRDRSVPCPAWQRPYTFTATGHGALITGSVCAPATGGKARITSISYLR